MALHPGLLIGDRYLLAQQIAVGGMGEVWEAADQLLGRQVAVKLLRSEFGKDTEFIDRFRVEARTAGVINHRNIAAVHDYGEDADAPDGATAFLVMELVHGEPLSSRLAAKGKLDPAETLALLEQAGRALQAAHEHGFVHRDVKPGNILLSSEEDTVEDGTDRSASGGRIGPVKLTDFGIAKAANTSGLTESGLVLGTAHYIAPEQAVGEDAGPASDVYSLGVVGYECLAGRRPYHADSSADVAAMHVNDPLPPLPSDIPTQIRKLIEYALVKNPKNRYRDGTEFTAAVAAVRRGRPAPRPGSLSEAEMRLLTSRAQIPTLAPAPAPPLGTEDAPVRSGDAEGGAAARPHPTPAPRSSASPPPTPTPRPSTPPTPTPRPKPKPSPTPKPTPKPSPVPKVTSKPSPAPKPLPGSAVKPAPAPTSKAAPAPKPIPTAQRPIPKPTSAPVPAPKPATPPPPPTAKPAAATGSPESGGAAEPAGTAKPAPPSDAQPTAAKSVDPTPSAAKSAAPTRSAVSTPSAVPTPSAAAAETSGPGADTAAPKADAPDPAEAKPGVVGAGDAESTAAEDEVAAVAGDSAPATPSPSPAAAEVVSQASEPTPRALPGGLRAIGTGLVGVDGSTVRTDAPGTPVPGTPVPDLPAARSGVYPPGVHTPGTHPHTSGPHTPWPGTPTPDLGDRPGSAPHTPVPGGVPSQPSAMSGAASRGLGGPGMPQLPGLGPDPGLGTGPAQRQAPRRPVADTSRERSGVTPLTWAFIVLTIAAIVLGVIVVRNALLATHLGAGAEGLGQPGQAQHSVALGCPVTDLTSGVTPPGVAGGSVSCRLR